MKPLVLLSSRTCVVAALLVLAGCAAPSFEYMAELDDGQKARAEIVNGMPIMLETRDVKLAGAAYVIDPVSKGVYGRFAATMKDEFKPVSIVVEDVTNKPFITWIEDKAPVFTADGFWEAKTSSNPAKSAQFEWLSTLSNSMRVFRFTFTAADGRKVVINQPASYSSFTKVAMRQAAGIEEQKAP